MKLILSYTVSKMLDLSCKAKIRLYFPGKLSLKSPVKLENKQVHYLINVMRKKIDDSILVFNLSLIHI